MAGPPQNVPMVARDPNGLSRAVECDANGQLLTSTTLSPPNPNVIVVGSTAWTITYIDDETLGDSDKVIALNALYTWHILAIRVEYTSDANAGARQLAIEFRDNANDVIWEVRPDLTQAASLTYLYNFGSSMSDLDAVRDTNWVSTPIPPTLLFPGGSDIRIYDNNAISAAGDDMIIHITAGWRTA